MFFWMAFGLLTKSRDTGMGIGSIKFDSILSYAKLYDLSLQETETLIEIIVGMDEVFIDASRSKAKD